MLINRKPKTLNRVVDVKGFFFLTTHHECHSLIGGRVSKLAPKFSYRELASTEIDPISSKPQTLNQVLG